MRLLAFIALIFFQLLCDGYAEASGKRVALVIGNANYQHAPALATSSNDATDIGNALARLGFDVLVQQNLTKKTFRSALKTYAEKAKRADIAIIYFAGYSLMTGIDGYLVPTDARIISPASLSTDAISLRDVIFRTGQAKSLGLIILDALHGNPFAIDLEQTDFGSSTAEPKENTDLTRNVLLFLANDPKRASEPGSGRNSPIVEALLEYLPKPGLEINFLLRNVRDHVRKTTHSRQSPYTYGQLSSDKIFLNPERQSPPPVLQSSHAITHTCDDLAAAPDDPQKNPAVAGVKLESIRTSEAISACSDAIRDFPNVSRFYYQLGRSQFAAGEHDLAIENYKRAFERGSTFALFALGSMYEGNEARADATRARFYYLIAAERNFAPALVGLGNHYERGIGGPKDLAKAYELYKRASALGNAQAFARMGRLAENGIGQAKNARLARTYYEKSAQLGDLDGMIDLARCFANGIGGRKDIREAKRLLTRASESGSKLAQAILAQITKSPAR